MAVDKISIRLRYFLVTTVYREVVYYQYLDNTVLTITFYFTIVKLCVSERMLMKFEIIMSRVLSF